jgi:hypothetical protein
VQRHDTLENATVRIPHDSAHANRSAVLTDQSTEQFPSCTESSSSIEQKKCNILKSRQHKSPHESRPHLIICEMWRLMQCSSQLASSPGLAESRPNITIRKPLDSSPWIHHQTQVSATKARSFLHHKTPGSAHMRSSASTFNVK